MYFVSFFAFFYNVAKRLVLCEEVSHSKCGDVLFHGYLNPPGIKLAFSI